MDELQLLNEMDSNLEFLKAHYSEIKSNHLDEFVAIKEGKLIAFSKDFERLVKEMREKKEDPTRVLIEFIPSIPLIL